METRMPPASVDAAARELARTREAGRPLDRLPPELVPPTIADAYRIQLEVHRQLAPGRGPRGGWKIGCTTPVMQAYLGIATPSAGALYARTIAHGAGTFAVGRSRLGVECELAVRLGRDLMGSAARDAVAVSDAVVAVMPAIEVVEDRYVDHASLDAGTLVADDFFGAGCVLGTERADWRGLDLAAVTATMTVDGREVGSGIGRDILGDPLAALRWLAAWVDELGEPLRAGHVVLLGSLVQTCWVAPGARVEVHNTPLGEVHATFISAGTA